MYVRRVFYLMKEGHIDIDLTDCVREFLSVHPPDNSQLRLGTKLAVVERLNI